MPALPFTRFLQVAARVKLGNAPGINVLNLDGEGHTITWDILRKRRGPEEGTITIYNLGSQIRGALGAAYKAAQRKVLGAAPDVGRFLEQGVGRYETALLLAEREVAQPYGYKIELGIGWEGRTSLVYRGDAISVRPSRVEGVDVVTDLVIGSKAWQDAAAGASFANVTVSLMIQLLVQGPAPTGLGLQIEYDSLQKIEERGAEIGVREYTSWARAGKTSEMVDDLLAAMDLEGKVHNGRFVVTDRGNAATTSPIAFQLSPGTGLLDWTETDDDGLEVTALAIPDIQPGHQVAVTDLDARPIGARRHRVESVRLTGTTEGQSTMHIECRKAVLL